MEYRTLTDNMIQDGMSKNGGWSDKQLICLGAEKVKGWRKRLIGKRINAIRYEKFLSLKDEHLKKGRRRRNSTLDKAMGFIMDNFSYDSTGQFNCPHIDCIKDCDLCDTQKRFYDILDEYRN